MPKGTLVIRAAEQIGVQIPRFCDHPLLEPVGACRQCLVEVSMPGPDGTPRPMPKPQASCTLAVGEGMVVKTQRTSPVADKAQHGVMELLLINHPLDCPVCDKGGECPLQNQAMSNGRSESRFVGVKRTFPKPVHISSQVLLDRDRCVLCARCTRFSKQIAGDPFIELVERGALQQVGIYAKHPFESYFSGNTVQICPVGALTGAAYRFRSRPFDLKSAPSVCEHCASGCAHPHRHPPRRRAAPAGARTTRRSTRSGTATRVAGPSSTPRTERLTHPMVRDDATGELRIASWPEALTVAAQGLSAARAAGGVGVLTGGRVTHEDAYAYAKFARVALGTNDVDFRARPHSAEEAEFLAHAVAGAWVGTEGVDYAELEAAPAVLLVGFEPEEESPIVFLRLRKAVRTHGQQVVSVASWATRGLDKLRRSADPGRSGHRGRGRRGDRGRRHRGRGHHEAVAHQRFRDPGRRAAGDRARRADRGAAARRRDRRPARLGAAPGRRARCRRGRRAAEPAARRPARRRRRRPGWTSPPPGAWTTCRSTRAATPARCSRRPRTRRARRPARRRRRPGRPAGPAAALEALDAAGFVVSLELRTSAVTERADVVLPVAPVAEKGGTFWNWEGRERPFDTVLDSTRQQRLPGAGHAGRRAGRPARGCARWTRSAPRRPRSRSGTASAVAAPAVDAAEPPTVGPNQAVLATWHLLLDAGRLQDGEPWLAGTARRPVARLSAATAAEVGVDDGELLTVAGERGSLTLPLVVTDLPDRAVWLPTNQTGYRGPLHAGGRCRLRRHAEPGRCGCA